MKGSRILYITYNGVGESIFQSQCLPYIAGLSGKGHDITLLSYERDAAARLKHKKYLTALGIKWVSLKYHKRPRAAATTYDFLLGMVVSLFLTFSRGIAIIHARATHGAIIGAAAANLFRRKLLFDTRGLDSEEYVDGNLITKGSFLHKALFGVERYLFSKADSIVLLSSRARILLKEKGLGGYIDNDRIHVIPCAVDLNLFKFKGRMARKEIRGFKLIYVGSIGTWYMVGEMFDFFMALRSRSKDARFAIFTQSDATEVREKVNTLNVTGCTEIAYSDHSSINERISNADAGICFIRPVSSKRASSPTKIGEYLACGLPVIVNAGIGDTEEIVRNNRVGIVIDGFTPRCYDKAVGELMAMMEDSDVFKRCRATAEKHFSLNDAVDKYDIIYRKLTDEA